MEERKSRLEQQYWLYQLNREVDELEQWIAQKEVVASSPELGQDYEHVTVSVSTDDVYEGIRDLRKSHVEIEKQHGSLLIDCYIVLHCQTFLHSTAEEGLASPHSIPGWEKYVLWFIGMSLNQLQSSWAALTVRRRVRASGK